VHMNEIQEAVSLCAMVVIAGYIFERCFFEEFVARMLVWANGINLLKNLSLVR